MKTVLKVFPFFLPILLMAKPEKIALQEIEGVEKNKEPGSTYTDRSSPTAPQPSFARVEATGGSSWKPRDMVSLNGSTAKASQA